VKSTGLQEAEARTSDGIFDWLCFLSLLFHYWHFLFHYWHSGTGDIAQPKDEQCGPMANASTHFAGLSKGPLRVFVRNVEVLADKVTQMLDPGSKNALRGSGFQDPPQQTL
jgi:hypothetical protein